MGALSGSDRPATSVTLVPTKYVSDLNFVNQY